MRLALVIAVAAGCAAGQERAPVTFESTTVDVGGAPYALVAADVTEDGAPDLVVADQRGERVVVLEGDGQGGFGQVAEAPAGPGPGGLAAADFDGDGHLDLAAANHESDRVTLLRGRGDGTFRPFPSSPLRSGVEPHVHLVAAADLDGDGRADLVVDHRDAGGLKVFMGRGDATFGPGVTVDMGGDPYRGIRIVDLDGDGHLDLVTPNEREVGVRPGRGDGTFGELREVDVSPLAPFTVAVGDVDGDGTMDLGAGSGAGSSEVAVYLGGAARGFRPAPGSPFDAGAGATNMEAADLDGDGSDDLIVASWDARELTILFGGEGRIRTTAEVGENPWAVTSSDFDGDGRPDVATANYGEGTVTVLLTRANGRGPADTPDGDSI